MEKVFRPWYKDERLFYFIVLLMTIVLPTGLRKIFVTVSINQIAHYTLRMIGRNLMVS